MRGVALAAAACVHGNGVEVTAYYNEIEPFAAQWLRNLISAGHIAPGDVDERSIADVRPDDLKKYTQCHFFAGIGVWAHALRRAGWPDDRPVWTGSCPCQPYSVAGRQAGVLDERHLWPAWHWLIRERRPPVIFGEQVASKAALTWLELVQSDLEGEGYAVGSADICAASLGAPHIRQRLWFVADAMQSRWAERRGSPRRGQATGGGGAVRVADADMPEQDSGRAPSGEQPLCDERGGCTGTVEHPESEQARVSRLARERRATGGYWADADWLPCQGGKWRPIEPGTFPLAHGVACRMDKLRAYGNAICSPVAQAFIEAAMTCLPD